MNKDKDDAGKPTGSDVLPDSFLTKLRAWHLADRRAGLERAFELGDLLISAVIHTGMTEYEVIRRLREDLADVAYGITTYNRAARISRVFTKGQRAVLIEKGLSLEKAEVLAGERYDGKRRIKTIANIKSGHTKAPWKSIKTYHPVFDEEDKNDCRESDDKVTIRIKDKGDLYEEGIVDGVRSMISQVPQEYLTRTLNAAVDRLIKSGHKELKHWRLE